jgi:uncharacterized membrane protein YqjE
MEADPSQGTRASVPSPVDSLRELGVFLICYLELRLQLLGLESRETAFHLLVLALLLVSTVVSLGSFVAMLVVFLLYLMMLTLHWDWGWSALALAAVLLVLSIGVAIIFRFRIAKPVFPATFAEFRKDREWLKHSIKSDK